MKKIQQPKKQPEVIRKKILEQAIILASEQGSSSISIQSVANRVGISKGGVFHHFVNKETLLNEMVNEIIHHLNQKVENIILHDNTQYGKFTRAYIHTSFMSEIDGLVSPWSALSMIMITNTTFNEKFGTWVRDKVNLYKETDDHNELEFIRLATDGLWLQHVTNNIEKEACFKYRNELIDRTYSKL